jgi:NADPH:quinone reductase-like Zn-dependent oxidoreductase
VYIHGAAGGIGHLAVQIAEARGAYVIGSAGAADHRLLRDLGGDEVIDRTRAEATSAVRDVEVVPDLVGGETAVRSLGALRAGGVLIGVSSGVDAARAAAAGRVRVVYLLAEPDRQGLEGIAALADEGRLRVRVARTFPLAQAEQAHRVGQAGGLHGKLVLTVGNDP